jgi:hypothetical protein
MPQNVESILASFDALTKQFQASQDKLDAKLEALEAREAAVEGREQALAVREAAPSDHSGAVHMPGQENPWYGRVRAVDASEDQKLMALDGFWAGEDLPTANGRRVRRFQSMREAYEVITGKGFHPMAALHEAAALNRQTGRRYDSFQRDPSRMVEAIQTGDWAQVLGDSITRRMLAEYRRPDLSTWRAQADTSNVADFRTQRRLRVGGYGLLPIVAESASYTPLASPPDEEATYAIAKRGGLELITLEAMSNDSDTGALRRIPQKLGRAAARTIYRAVYDLVGLNMALTLTGDTSALFHNSHNNHSAGAVLNVANLDTAIYQMGQQTEYGVSTEILGLEPRYILFSADLRAMVDQIVGTTTGLPFTMDNSTNVYRSRYRLEPIEVAYWPSNTWVLAADKADVSLCEVGYYRGQEEPEIFIADQENVEGGAMWSADRIGYKIRFIFGTLIPDYRGWWGNL